MRAIMGGKRTIRTITVALLSLGVVAAAGRSQSPDRQAVELTQRIARNANATGSDAIVQYFTDRLALAALPLSREAAPLVQRVRYLTANNADRRRLRQIVEPVLTSLDEVCREIDQRLERARRQEDMVIIGLPSKLTRVGQAAEYKRAWVRLYLAMSLHDGVSPPAASVAARRRRLLADAADAVADHAARPDNASGVKYASLLLRGMVANRLGSLDRATPALQAAATAQAPVQIRMAALFELARFTVDAGQWDQAARRTTEFATRCAGMVQADQRVQVDLYAALLTERLCRRRAGAAGDASEAARWRRRADRAVADLLVKYDERLAAVCGALARPWSDEPDVDALSGPVAFARGVSAARTVEGDAAAVECFRSVLGRTDPVSRELKPRCLWRLASTLYKQGRRQGTTGWPARQEAAEQFGRLAREHADDPRAAQAAVNGARILGAHVAAMETAGRPVGPDLRRRYAAALELVAVGWPARDEVLGYTYRLGQQYERLGRPEDAIRWYARVAASAPEYVPARSNELTLRSRGLAQLPAAERIGPAKALIEAWKDLADIARKQAGSATGSTSAAELLGVAAQADYSIAQLLADPLGRTDQAIKHCQAATKKWAGRPPIAARLEAFRIELLLDQGKLREAVEAVDRFGPSDGAAADRLAVLTVLAIRRKVDTTESRADATLEAVQWRELYLRFARRAAEAMASQPAEAQYPFQQILAGALAESARSDEALKIFDRLARSRPDDANNVQGKARCYWLAGRYGEALALYRRFVSGVDVGKQPAQWWRGQLALARCAYEQAAGDRTQLKRLAVRLEQLRLRDDSFGGHGEAFEALRGRIGSAAAEE